MSQDSMHWTSSSMVHEFKRSGAYVNVASAGWTIRILVGTNDCSLPCDFEVHAPSGERYAAVAATIDQLVGLMNAWRSSGECLAGEYLWIENLIVVRSLSPEALVDVANDLIRTGEIEGAMQLLEGQSEET